MNRRRRDSYQWCSWKSRTPRRRIYREEELSAIPWDRRGKNGEEEGAPPPAYEEVVAEWQSSSPAYEEVVAESQSLLPAYEDVVAGSSSSSSAW